MRLSVRASCAALPLALAVTACSVPGLTDGDATPDVEGTDPGPVAIALAEGLDSGDLTGVAFTELTDADATADLVETVEGMGDLDPEVLLSEVVADESDPDAATATLTWSWPLTDDDTWAYETTAALARTATDADWEVVWDHAVVESSLNAASVLEVDRVSGDRGDIIGAGGTRLVTERSVLRVGIDRSQVPAKRARASAQALARLVDVEVQPYVKQVVGAGEKAFVEAITYRTADIPAAVDNGYERIRGARIVATEMPLALTRDFAAPILGRVGEVTAEMIEDDPTLEVGDVAGLSGLEARYDDQLRAGSATVVSAVGSDGKARRLHRTGRAKGENLRIPLDETLQTQAEALLSDVGPASALVALRPSDGAVLAAANGPGNSGQNFATFGQYAPGSTFKTVSSLALLRSGRRPTSTVTCSDTITVDGRVFGNYSDYPAGGTGRIPLSQAVANSCNTAFIDERTRLDDGDLAAAAATLGMGIDHDLGFPAYFGSVEPPTTETGAAADMIGQGTILASPLVMATVIASVQSGTTVVPRLVEQVDVAVPDEAPALTAAEAKQLRGLLRGVVTSGSGRGLADVPGKPVIAKTGTAEYDDDGTTRTHAWMIAAQGDLAVAVFVETGSGGSSTAGPIVEAFLRAAQ
ncbi:MAG: penicillin-binding protein [Nocardioides sp.]|nr:penicillin-binding protein [Nocardioides sp.]